MSFLSRNKDVNVIILSKLNFLDLREVLTVNRETNKYNSDILWFRYQERNVDFELMQSFIQRPWKEFSLWYEFMKNAKINHYFYPTAAFRKKYPWDFFMALSAEKGSMDCVKFFITKGANNWNVGMYGAALGGNSKMVQFFIAKGANDWICGRNGAILGKCQNLMDFFEMKLQGK